jgi:dipeptidyl aminopeptidase/acylaminoacyl peptidase
MDVMADLIRSLLETKSAVLADVELASDPSERLLVRSDLTGTMQLYELAAGELCQVTDLPEPVGGARYIPSGRRAVIEVDRGGDERHQLYIVGLDAVAEAEPAELEHLTSLTSDERYGHHIAGVSSDGRVLAYLSNKGNGVDFDLWVCDLATGEHRCLYAGGGWCQPASGFSPDGRWVSVLRPGPRPLDVDLLLVEVATGEARTVLPHPDHAAEVGSPAWVDATTCYVSSNVDGDYAGIVRYDLITGEGVPLAGTGESWDAEPVTSNDGKALIVIENRNGSSRMTLLDSDNSGQRAEIPLAEPGTVMSYFMPRPMFSKDGARVYFTLSTPRLAGDVWAHHIDSGETSRLTASPAPIEANRLVTAETAQAESFDGQQIPLFTYRPSSGGSRPPVVVMVHGGPEAQAMLSFDPVVQALALAGYAVVVPNVRGSTGYGKRYAALDDTTRRLDSVRDLAAVHDWLDAAGLDADRAALWGGSYGGYMVLAGLAFQPELWAAGIDMVGISDLVTFLENTSDYRRAHREREYGSLAHDREFLASASPLRHVDAMRAPLFVIHGRNDPRVPVSEAEQLATGLVERGVRCELVIYDDEGHGLARLVNRVDACSRAVAFLDDVLHN